MPRGLLIVVEGLDRAGKSSVVLPLVRSLRARHYAFPDRTTASGRLLDSHLRGERVLGAGPAHLAFALNRRERAGEILAALRSGTHVVIERYAYSGVAYTAATGALTEASCKEADAGLPRPDIVCFLDVDPGAAAARAGYGLEIYDSVGFQAAARSFFVRLAEVDWIVVDTTGLSLDEVVGRVLAAVLDRVGALRAAGALDRPVGVLWS